MRKGFAPILLIIGLLVVIALIGGIYYFSKKTSTPSASNSIAQKSPMPSQVPVTEDWKTYDNKAFGFSIQYPPSLKITGEPKLSHNESQGNFWILNLDDRENDDPSGSTIKNSISVQFSSSPISGESGQPIVDIKGTFADIPNPTFFKLQGYDAVRLEQALNSTTNSNGIPKDFDIMEHVIKNKSLWTISGYAKDYNSSQIDMLKRSIASFKFTQ